MIVSQTWLLLSVTVVEWVLYTLDVFNTECHPFKAPAALPSYGSGSLLLPPSDAPLPVVSLSTYFSKLLQDSISVLLRILYVGAQ
jgi:hypothetical protein